MASSPSMDEDLVYRVKKVNGVVTPAFIHNFSFHFVNLPVFADGLVDCWELLDLDLFKEKLETGWVVPFANDGEEMSVHGLGSWTVAEGRWLLDADGLHQRVVDLVRRLNPRMENLHNCHGRTTEKVGKIKSSILGCANEKPMRWSTSDMGFASPIDGDHVSVFARQKGRAYLADLRVFSDGTVQLGRLPKPLTLDLDGLRSAIESGDVITTLAKGTKMHIHGLGELTVAEEHWSAEVTEVEREVHDLVDALTGRPSSIARCKAAYEAYCTSPSEPKRLSLKEAYEQVPEHNRMYVGDMDTKDIPVRMIIYGDEEIEGWSHRAVARAHGHEELPTITVPKVEEDTGSS